MSPVSILRLIRRDFGASYPLRLPDWAASVLDVFPLAMWARPEDVPAALPLLMEAVIAETNSPKRVHVEICMFLDLLAAAGPVHYNRSSPQSDRRPLFSQV